MTHLVTVVITDTDATVRKSALNVIAEAIHSKQLPHASPSYCSTISRPCCQPCSTTRYILGATHDPAARPAIEAFINHPDANVRRHAADGVLSELPGRRTTT